MSLYQLLETQYQLKIKKDKSQPNNTTIEMITNSDFFKELFLTKIEKVDNTLYYNLTGFIFFIEFCISILISCFIFKDKNFEFAGICCSICSIVIFFVIIIISTPLYDSLKKNFFKEIDDKNQIFTEKGKIKLTFYSHGLEIVPNNYYKEPIFIESLNISKIYVKPKIKEEEKLFKEYQPNDLNYLNIMLRLHKPITNPLTMENINELPLIEDIHKDFFKEEAINFIEEIKQTLKLQDR